MKEKIENSLITPEQYSSNRIRTTKMQSEMSLEDITYDTPYVQLSIFDYIKMSDCKN